MRALFFLVPPLLAAWAGNLGPVAPTNTDRPVAMPLADAGADVRADAERGSDARSDSDAPPPPVPACVKVQSQAIFSGSGYDHVVSIDNGCTKDADCQVSTDLATDSLSVSVPSGETRDLVTYRGSPSSEFTADVKCSLRK